jgi:hypothetical protein
MQKIIVTLMFVLGMAFISPTLAQGTNEDAPHNELYAGIGFLNSNQVLSMTSDIVGTILTLGLLVQPHSYNILTPSVGYRYWFNKRIGIGAHFAFDKNSVKVLPAQATDWEIHQRFFYTFAADFNWNYMYKSTCQLYGNIGMGATVVSFSGNSADQLQRLPYFNMHLSPFGVRVGKTIAGFAEIGWGYKGIINIGVSAKF